MASLDAKAGGGESFGSCTPRVRAGLEALLARRAGETVAVVSHVTPIKILVADALGAPLEAVFRMELSPASVTVVAYFPGERRRAIGDGLPAAVQRAAYGCRTIRLD